MEDWIWEAFELNNIDQFSTKVLSVFPSQGPLGKQIWAKSHLNNEIGVKRNRWNIRIDVKVVDRFLKERKNCLFIRPALLSTHAVRSRPRANIISNDMHA